jgi:hypothetical protein
MNFARLRVFYWTQTVSNESTEGTVDAKIDDSFKSPIFDNVNNYVLAIERFEINTNAIPFFDGDFGVYQLEIFDTLGVSEQILSVDFKAYSLFHFISKLNSLVGAAAAPASGMSFSIDAEGFITMDFNLNDHYVVFSERINRILGLETSDMILNNGLSITSTHPRLDCGDEIDHIRISSDMQVISDTVGENRTNIITDLSNAGSFSASSDDTSDFSYNQRQKLVYTPNTRRYLNFATNAPLTSIRITAQYIRTDGTVSTIPLPRGASFSIKLGFYLKV